MTDPTPAAPLSPEGLVRALRTCRGITQHEQDCISNAAKALAAANARIAALDRLYEAAFQRSVEAVAYRDEALDRAEKAEARTAEVEAERDAAIADRRRHFLAAADATVRAKSLERKNERHVARLQEIGKGVEADQATIARLTADLAQADAVIADEDGDVLMEDRILWRNQAIARHVARRSAGEGREG